MTETTQPDPQVVISASLLRRLADYAQKADVDGLLGDCDADRPCDVCTAMEAVEVALTRTPLTAADIPAGQGSASLFIAPDSFGTPRVYYKDSDGDITAWSYSADSRQEPVRAMWDHLAATLPHLTA